MSDPVELKEFLRWEPEYPDPLIGGGLLYAEGKAIVYGRYKVGKSMLAMNIGLSIADGQPILGFPTTPLGASVLYLQLEMPKVLLHKRQKKLWSGWRQGEDLEVMTKQPIHYWTEPFLKLNRPDGLAVLERRMAEFKPTVLIIDPIYKIMQGGIRDSDQVGALLDSLDKMIANHNCAVILVGHTRKSAFEEETEWGSDDLIGSVLFSAWADTIIKVAKKGGQANRDILQFNFDVVRNAEDLLEPKEVLFDRTTLMFREVSQLVVT